MDIDISTSGEPSVPRSEDPAPTEANKSPVARKRSKLDPSAKGLLKEIFALQDSLNPFESEALAAKVIISVCLKATNEPDSSFSIPAWCPYFTLLTCLFLRWDIAQL